SIRDAVETVVPAANKMGKDWKAGQIILKFFLAPWAYFDHDYFLQVDEARQRWNKSDGKEGEPSPHTVRIVTTSVDEAHLIVLWDEIANFVRTCRYPLDAGKGGILKRNHMDIRKFAQPYAHQQLCPKSYVIGRVSANGEGLAGHHAAYTLYVLDEAS